MHITHNEIVTVLGAALSLIIYIVGWRIGHWRAYAECCDCCTCQICTDQEEVMPVDSGWTETRSAEPETLVIAPRRHTVVLEPGPTIYPALAELAGEVMDEPESQPDASDSTFVRKLLIEWEQRYPIPVGAP